MTWIKLFIKSQPLITSKTLLEFLKTTEEPVSMSRNMWRLRWPRTELQSLSIKTTIAVTRSWFSTRLNKERSVNKHILSSTRSSISSGTRIFSTLKRKTLRLSENSRIDIPNKLKKTAKFSRKNCLLLSNSLLSSSTSRKFKKASLSKRNTPRPIKFKWCARTSRSKKEKSTWKKDTRRSSQQSRVILINNKGIWCFRQDGTLYVGSKQYVLIGPNMNGLINKEERQSIKL